MVSGKDFFEGEISFDFLTRLSRLILHQNLPCMLLQRSEKNKDAIFKNEIFWRVKNVLYQKHCQFEKFSFKELANNIFSGILWAEISLFKHLAQCNISG